MDSLIEKFEGDGFLVVPDVFEAARCESLARGLKADGSPGSRNVLERQEVRALATALKHHAVVGQLLPTSAVAVQCTVFDKSPQANWFVPPHQDTSIPVRERISHRECVGWSEKEGVPYVQPPTDVLESLVAVRVALDDASSDTGALSVVPASHRRGKLSAAAMDLLRRDEPLRECVLERGSAMLMRPLLLHGSSKMKRPARRRVLHFLFGSPSLPYGLRWHDAV